MLVAILVAVLVIVLLLYLVELLPIDGRLTLALQIIIIVAAIIYFLGLR